MTSLARLRFALGCPAVALLSLVACESSTDPLVDRLDPPLAALWAQPVATVDGYASFTSGLLPDQAPLRQGEAAVFRITSSRGDAEVLRLLPAVPIRISGVSSRRIPLEYVLMPEPGADFAELLRDAEALGVRHRVAPPSTGDLATSYVTGANESAVVAAVRALPGLRTFEPNTLGCVVVCEPVLPEPLWGVVILDQRPTPTADDGVLSVSAGDTLRIAYRNASGEPTVFRTVVQ